MLEDSKMEKKSVHRSSQPQSRASAIDCKKSSDTSQKPWPRNSKKREGPGNAPKNEPYRKNSAPRGRGQVDRRPRPRGSGNYSMGGVENTWIAEEEPELGSVFVPGSKKQNLNHLLNFMYTPRGVQERDRAGPAPRRHNPQRVSAVHPHNHELYLQGCCQFVVKEDGDYKANLLDPDVPVKWDQIEEIVIRSTGKSECPICLGPPAAGRVGRCGHVHCWACALHYAAAHERNPPPCPVCAAPFKVDSLKPARMIQWDAPTEEITMRLVRRLRGSTAVEEAPPRGELIESSSAPLPLEQINKAPYSKLFYATKDQVYKIMDREKEELQNQILCEIDTTEVCYMEQALEMLKKEEANLKLQPVAAAAPPTLPEVNDNVPAIVYEKQAVNEAKYDWFDVGEDEEGAVALQEQISDLATNIEQSTLNPKAPEFEINDNEPVEFPLVEDEPINVPEEVTDNMLSEADKENQSKYFYFYQASDGQQVFLSSLNVRVLVSSWGALCAAPRRLAAAVLRRDTFSLTEQTRKHMPFTAHLPLHCPFDIVELDLKPPHVTNAALQIYAEEVERHARARARAAREERRRERQWRRAAEGPPRPDLASSAHFPPAPSSPPYCPPPCLPSVSPPAQPVPAEPTGLSFAKMAGSGGGGAWRVRATPRKPAPAGASEAGTAESGGEGCSRAPALSLSDAIEAALLAAPQPTGARKKKNKHKPLFTTGMTRLE